MVAPGSQLSAQMAVDRVVDTLNAFSSCILVDKVPEVPVGAAVGPAGGGGEEAEDRDELLRLQSVVHRAVLSASAIYQMARSTRKSSTTNDSEPTSSSAVSPPGFGLGSQSASKKKSHSDVLQEFWGPVLVVCAEGDLTAWEEGLQPLVRRSGMVLLPYRGEQTDRDQLLTYLNLQRVHPAPIGHIPITVNVNLSSSGSASGQGNNLYSERSPCHVVLMSMEVFLSDFGIFHDILWELQVWDQPWGPFIRSATAASTSEPLLLPPVPVSGKGSKSKASSGSGTGGSAFKSHYRSYQQMIAATAMSRRRLFSCDSLYSRTDGGLPDLMETLLAVFPSSVGLNTFYHSNAQPSGRTSLVNLEAEHYLLSNSVIINFFFSFTI